MEECLLFAADPVIFTDIFVKSPGSELLLFLGKPSCGSREVGKNEEREQGDKDLLRQR